ncbi:MAG: hypothetical protein E6K18_05645 [Methanobacteriota archaeon]|nr:MAG: hypothetical protein E6K18_05645 [Euryarchaeota archaeon]
MTAAGAAVSLGAAILSAIFAAMVLKNFVERRKPYNLMWGVGLVMFAFVAMTQVLAELVGWSEGLFKAWYLLGTSLVAFLGAGSVYIAHRRLGHAFAAYVLIVFLAFLAAVALTAVNPATLEAFSAGAPPSGEAWAVSTPRGFSPLLTIPGTFALIGIALYGLIRYRLTYNAYIAGGAIVLAVGTGLARFGIPSLIYAAEFAGIALMFVGFWKAIEWAKEHRKATPGGGPPPAVGAGEPQTTEGVDATPK